VSKLFVSKRTRAAAWVILLVLPALMAAFGYYHSHRPTVNPVGSRTFWDYVILNSDILLGLFFLLVSAIPFLLVFDKRRPQARELVPIAVMAAIAVVGRTVFEIIPLPSFKPCSAIIIITAVAFGPEAGFLTGALTAFVSNFIFGQGPWTPWQMFTWGLVGFLAGILQNAGVFAEKNRRHFTAKLWDRLCPENTNRGDLLHFVRQLTDPAAVPVWFPVRLFVRLDHEPVFHYRLRQPPYMADDRRGLSIQLFLRLLPRAVYVPGAVGAGRPVGAEAGAHQDQIRPDGGGAELCAAALHI
jgi:hypothetical protein